MKFTFGRSKSIYMIHAIFLVVLCCIAVGFFIASSMQTVLLDSRAVVQRREQTIGDINVMVALTVDAETAQRGYLLTGDVALLTPYERDREALNEKLAEVESELVADPVQLSRFQNLKAQIKSRVGALATVVSLYQEQGEAAITAESLAENAKIMAGLRDAADEMISHEKKELAQDAANAEEDQRLLDLALTIGSIVSCVGLVLFHFVVVRLWTQLYNNNLQKDFESDVVLGATDKDTLARRCKMILQSINNRVPYDLGAFYLIADDQLNLMSTIGTKGELPQAQAADQGLLGEFLQSQEVILMNELPTSVARPDVVKTSSAFVQGGALKLAFIPIWLEDEPFGIIEIGRFRAEFTQRDRLLLESCIYAIGRSVNSLRFRERLRTLLHESEEQRLRLHTQQEELRVTNEELEQQTEALQKAKVQLQHQQEELRQSNEELEQQTSTLELQKEIMDARNHDLLEAKRDLEDSHKKLEKTSRYKTEFLANMSHELRTPLNSLLILSGILKSNRDNNLTDEQIEFATIINKSGADLLNLINDILDLSKIEAGKLSVQWKETLLVDVAQDMRHQFLAQAKDKNLAFKVTTADAPSHLLTDSDRLEQILKNFLSNAFKFTASGEVELNIRSMTPEEYSDADSFRNGGVCFEVKDTGIGIPQDKLGKIFNAFEQVDSAIDRQYGGTGLGLTICEQLAKMLGGRIGVSSTPDQGSTFTLYLPENPDISETAATSETRPETISEPAMEADSTFDAIAELPGPGTGEKENTILIIEDDVEFARILSSEAKARDFSVLVASDMISAVSHLKAGRPRAIILDVRLPDGNGLVLLDRIKQNPMLRSIPIHIVSAFDYKQNALRLGALGYCTKPLSMESMGSMFDRIESVIKRPVKSLLVVEDDPIQQKALQQLLKSKDVKMIFASTGEEALKILHNETVDCMVLDLALPDTTGIDLLEALDRDETRSRPPVIVYTGQELDKELEVRLRHFSESIVIKSSKSPERLVREVSLFLHRVETQPAREGAASLARNGAYGDQFVGRSVLIVDDDLRNTFALTAILEPLGFEVVVARDGLEALTVVENHPDLDIVLMDIMMPKMDGIEATSRIRADRRHADLPIVALTAKAMKGDREKCLDAGANDYLTKPINVEKLISTLNIWIH